MLPKKHRLLVQNLPRRGFDLKRSESISLKIFPSNKSLARFNIIVSKKVAKKAVDRNNLKRSFFSVVETLAPKLPPADYLVIINKPISDKELKSEVKTLFDSLIY